MIDSDLINNAYEISNKYDVLLKGNIKNLCFCMSGKKKRFAILIFMKKARPLLKLKFIVNLEYDFKTHRQTANGTFLMCSRL